MYQDLINQLRNTQSRSKRALLDAAADALSNHQWISVNDRLPKLIQFEDGKAYSEAVNVLTTGRKVITAIWDGTDFIGDAEFWDAENEEITHWTPVLLPLPDAPN